MKAAQGWKHQFLQNLGDDLKTQSKILELVIKYHELAKNLNGYFASSWAQRVTVLLLLQWVW